jgi:hypothetical protein
MNLTEYAKHRGVSTPMISKMIRDGVLSDAYTKTGRSYDIDPAKADALLNQNLHQSMLKKSPPATPGTAQAATSNQMTLNEARTQKERYLAHLRRLEYEEKQGELVKAVEVQKLLVKLITTSKQKLLSIQSEIGQLLADAHMDPDTKARILTGVERIVNQTLTELSNAQ